MYTAVSIAILISMSFALARASLGPSIYDRILAVNMFGTKTVLLIAVLGYLMGRPEFLDIAIVYALINFISIIAVLRFFEYTRPAVDPRLQSQSSEEANSESDSESNGSSVEPSNSGANP
ncbi:MAG: pH regulation protein F [Agarilytica sp.]